jgi:dihydropyrimidinase
MLDALIKGGQVVNATSTVTADVGVADGKIAFLARPGAISVPAERVIEAAGYLVLPGGVDPHVHFDLRLSDSVTSQSSAAGSRAAAHGGTTTFIDFAWQDGDQSLVEAIELKRARLREEKPSIDYGLHAMMTGAVSNRVIDELEDATAAGVSSFKLFTTFSAGSAFGAWQMDDGRIWGVMQSVARHGGLVLVHCEDDCIINFCSRALNDQGLTDARHIAKARPNLAEEAATKRMLLLAERSGCPLYVVHLSSREAMNAVRGARSNGQRAFGEVLHNYLVFTSDDYERPNGIVFNNYPPLKSAGDRQALWEGVEDGTVDAVASDDCAIPLAAKLAGKHIDDLAGGHNGVETRLMVLFSEGVAKRRISVNRFVELTSANPAKLFGLFPRKGVLAPGSDADLVLWDPMTTRTIRQAGLHSACDYSIWDGFECTGLPVLTMAGGQVLVDHDKWVGPEGRGQFVGANAIA